MVIFVYESCMYNSPSVLDNTETRISCSVGMFLNTASTCLPCIVACCAD